ncbi:MAG: hypothetical protein HYY46_10845, partial [Deltaproteobacteria bacterium]|nr:hypothetical protein [Deltaproteobacteria bacterium]
MAWEQLKELKIGETPIGEIVGLAMNKKTMTLLVSLFVLLGSLFSFWVFKRSELKRLQTDLKAIEKQMAAQPAAASQGGSRSGVVGVPRLVLPRGVDKPQVVLEFVRLANKNQVQDLSLRIEEPKAAETPAGKKPPPVSPPGEGKVGSFDLKLTFSVGWRDLGYLLEDLRKSPYPIALQSLEVKREARLP